MVQLAGWKYLPGSLNGVYLLFSPPKTSDIFLNAQGKSFTGKGKGAAGRPGVMCFLVPYSNGADGFREALPAGWAASRNPSGSIL
jgi:hypothetical protein